MAKQYYTLPKIALIACGGTIGGEWSPAHDTVISSKRGNRKLVEYIHQHVRLHRKVLFVDLLNKDSRSITTKDRSRMFETIKRFRAKGVRHFLITHGTFTMVKTGAYLAKQLAAKKIDDTYVVLCGSMIPHLGFTPSDAEFNIGFAMANLMMLKEVKQAGVWIAMHGLLSKSSAIWKNVKKAQFKLKTK